MKGKKNSLNLPSCFLILLSKIAKVRLHCECITKVMHKMYSMLIKKQFPIKVYQLVDIEPGESALYSAPAKFLN